MVILTSDLFAERLHSKAAPLKATLPRSFPEIPSFTICSRTPVSRGNGWEAAMQAAIICSQATPAFVLKREENGEERGKGKKETNEPISLLKRHFFGSFIKRGEEFFLIGWLPETFITGQHVPLRFDTAILDNLLRTATRSLLPWILSDLFNIRKLIFNLKQMY